MAVLGHYELKKRLKNDLKIHPLEEGQIRETGIDLRLYRGCSISPNAFSLVWTKEWVEFPRDLMGYCNLRSFYAREGFFIPPTVVDPGFKGHLQIELISLMEDERPWEFLEGERFLHLTIEEVKGGKPYEGRYQFQEPK